MIVVRSRPAVRSNRIAVGALIVVTGWQLALAADAVISAHAHSAFGEPSPSAASINVATNPPAFQPEFQQANEFRLVPSRSLPTPPTATSVEPIGADTPSDVALFGT